MSKGTIWSNRPDQTIHFVCRSCRQKISRNSTHAPPSQVRWLSRNHAKRIIDAERDWKRRAEAIQNGTKKSFFQVLEERGFINQTIGPRDDLESLLVGRRVGAYCGIDPTASSMHLGHLVPFMALSWFYIHGYPVTFLLGGSTARVGDPTDRLTARTEMSRADRVTNITSMHMQLKRFGENLDAYARKHGYHVEWAWKRALTNNNHWWRGMSFLDFMKGPATVARMGPLLGRDSVKRRMEQGDGMSFSEFTYPLMQAYDWYKLYQTGTQLQIGGADQFGNILEGANIVKKLAQMENLEEARVAAPPQVASWEKGFFGKALTDEPMGFTVPLMTTASGEKFGKSAGNAIWLDPDMTSSFDLYGYFMRLPDNDVERFLKLFTFLPLEEISKIMEQHQGNESKRIAQHTLAYEFLCLAHGERAAIDAQNQHKQMFGGKLSLSGVAFSRTSDVPPGEINPSVNKYAPQTNANTKPGARIKLPRSIVEYQPLHKVMWSAGMVGSKAEGHRLATNGGAYVASEIGPNPAMGDNLSWTPIKNWSPSDVKRFLLGEDVLVLRIGKWKVKIIELVSDEEYEKLGLSCPGWGEESNAPTDDWKKIAQDKAEWIAARKAKRHTMTSDKANNTAPSTESVEESEALKGEADWGDGLFRKSSDLP